MENTTPLTAQQRRQITKHIANYREILSLCHAYQNQQHVKGQISYLEQMLNQNYV